MGSLGALAPSSLLGVTFYETQEPEPSGKGSGWGVKNIYWGRSISIVHLLYSNF